MHTRYNMMWLVVQRLNCLDSHILTTSLGANSPHRFQKMWKGISTWLQHLIPLWGLRWSKAIKYQISNIFKYHPMIPYTVLLAPFASDWSHQLPFPPTLIIPPTHQPQSTMAPANQWTRPDSWSTPPSSATWAMGCLMKFHGSNENLPNQKGFAKYPRRTP